MTEYQKVHVVNMFGVPYTENKRGSDCSGNSGDKNRVLTLSNTYLSQKELVSVDGRILTVGKDYTISHKISGTTITFLDKIFDSQYIDVRYFT